MSNLSLFLKSSPYQFAASTDAQMGRIESYGFAALLVFCSLTTLVTLAALVAV